MWLRHVSFGKESLQVDVGVSAVNVNECVSHERKTGVSWWSWSEVGHRVSLCHLMGAFQPGLFETTDTLDKALPVTSCHRTSRVRQWHQVASVAANIILGDITLARQKLTRLQNAVWIFRWQLLGCRCFQPLSLPLGSGGCRSLRESESIEMLTRPTNKGLARSLRLAC